MQLRFKYTGYFVTVFIVVAAMLLTALLFTLTYDKKFFSNTVLFETKFADAEGLSTSTPVMFKGFKIGRLTTFSLNDDNLVEAEFEVYEEYVNRVVEYSALYKTISPVSNSSVINLLNGPFPDKKAEAGSYIPSIDTPDGAQLLVDGKVHKTGDLLFNILINLNDLLESLNRKDSANQSLLAGSVERLYSLTASLDEMTSNIENLVDNLSIFFSDDKSPLNSALAGIDELSDNLKRAGTVLHSDLIKIDTLVSNYQNPEALGQKLIDPEGETTGKINSLLDETNILMRSINSQSHKLPLIIDNLQRTLDELKKTLRGLNANPLLNYGTPDAGEKRQAGRRVR